MNKTGAKWAAISLVPLQFVLLGLYYITTLIGWLPLILLDKLGNLQYSLIHDSGWCDCDQKRPL